MSTSLPTTRSETTEGQPLPDSRPRHARTQAVLWVLIWTFLLNFSTSVVKILVGWQSGLLNVLADGIHSLSDSFINIVGFISVKVAGRAPTDRYPYGYQKYETVATLIVGSIVFVLFLEIFKAAVEKLIHPVPTEVSKFAFVAMVISFVLNFVTVIYEGGMGRKLKSEFLIADSTETKSDLFVSAGVFVSLIFIAKGWVWVDGVVTLLISFIVLRASIEIFRSAAGILVDEAVLNPQEVIAVACSHSDVRWCHAVRSRGKPDAIYLDLHLGVDPLVTVEKAHDKISHEVKQLLDGKFPGLKCVMIHVEPDNEPARKREHSVFRGKDY